MRHWLPVFPGSLTIVASINRSVGRDTDSVTRPRSSNSAQQSRYSQSLLLRSRLSKATSESSASFACRALTRSEEHTSELQSLRHLVCRLLLEKKKYFYAHCSSSQ